MAGRCPAALAALRAVATECQALAGSLGDEQVAEGLAVTKQLRAIFQRLALTASAVPELVVEQVQPPELLTDVPPELLSIILSQLSARDLASLAATCCLLLCDAPTRPPSPPPGLVEAELRRRAQARGLHIGLSLPYGAPPWVPYLLK